MADVLGEKPIEQRAAREPTNEDDDTPIRDSDYNWGTVMSGRDGYDHVYADNGNHSTFSDSSLLQLEPALLLMDEQQLRQLTKYWRLQWDPWKRGEKQRVREELTERVGQNRKNRWWKAKKVSSHPGPSADLPQFLLTEPWVDIRQGHSVSTPGRFLCGSYVCFL